MKKISVKNYIILFLISIGVILVSLYINSWIKTYKLNKISTSPFINEAQIITLNELKTVTKEMNDVIVYMNYSNTKDTYNTDKKVLKYIKSNNLLNEFIYIDITNNENYKNELNNIFNTTNYNFEVPLLLYMINGDIVEIKNGNDIIDDLENLTKKYELTNN